MAGHRKLVRHFHEPGDAHELTFSTYQHIPLLSNDVWRAMLCTSIDRALTGHEFRLISFALMPDHVHLLVYPVHRKPNEDPGIDELLSAIKRPFSYRAKVLLAENEDPLFQRLTIRERPGKMTFRFWQEGPGYDRNISTESAMRSSIDYIHMKPVRAGLVERASDWKWSSAWWYESDGNVVDPELPKISGLPWEFFR